MKNTTKENKIDFKFLSLFFLAIECVENSVFTNK